VEVNIIKKIRKIYQKSTKILALIESQKQKSCTATNSCTFFPLPLPFYLSFDQNVASTQYEDYQDSSSNPKKDCSSKICYNHGLCVEQWLNPVCDCDLTTFTGPSCADGKNQ